MLSPYLEITFMLLIQRLKERSRGWRVGQSFYLHPATQTQNMNKRHIILIRHAIIPKLRWITLQLDCRIQTAELPKPDTVGTDIWPIIIIKFLVLKLHRIIDSHYKDGSKSIIYQVSVLFYKNAERKGREQHLFLINIVQRKHLTRQQKAASHEQRPTYVCDYE